VWLLGLYYDTLKNMIKFEKDKTIKKELELKLSEFRKNTKDTFEKAINEDGIIGSISEIYNSKKPQLPNGAPAQAWSVAEVFRIIFDALN
jgi:glycogen debranching enzyme